MFHHWPVNISGIGVCSMGSVGVFRDCFSGWFDRIHVLPILSSFHSFELEVFKWIMKCWILIFWIRRLGLVLQESHWSIPKGRRSLIMVLSKQSVVCVNKMPKASVKSMMLLQTSFFEGGASRKELIRLYVEAGGNHDPWFIPWDVATDHL